MDEETYSDADWCHCGSYHGRGPDLSFTRQVWSVRPFADDDGPDLLVYDKLTRSSLPIQVKARMGLDGPRGHTVQFNVRLKTFSSETGGYLLAVLLDRLAISCCWLIPAASLQQIAYARADQLIVVASPAENSRDKFSLYKHSMFEGVVSGITAAFTSRCGE
jgi:hypothetical protein